jgi:hypothetical protein
MAELCSSNQYLLMGSSVSSYCNQTDATPGRRIGNVVLIDEANQITWQSFAHPINIFSNCVFPTNSFSILLV